MSTSYENMSVEELKSEISVLEEQVDELRARDLSLDMTRGKPSDEQIALSKPMLDVLTADSSLMDGAVDAGNYGAPDGLDSARNLFAELLGVDANNILLGGSSSLNIMFDCISHAFVKGIRGNTPWSQQETIKFLCPSPGYDRHFGVSAHFGIENIPVAMTEDGPDMDEVARLVEGDETVKGIWCVPKYQNPTGITYSDEVVRRMAALRPAASDFRIYWDNAYIVHDLTDTPDELLNIFDVLAHEGREGLVYEFASTSKVTFAGSGISCVSASAQDISDLNSSFAVERVCTDKITQLMHARFLPDAAAVRAHMKKHAQVIAPKFEIVEKKLTENLADLEAVSWTKPNGGYFVSFEGPAGSAKAIVALAAELGVKLTNAGATWPYGNDPADTNIRIAPTYPTPEDLSQALEVFVVCVRLVCARLELERR